jgi:hypothetical protein
MKKPISKPGRQDHGVVKFRGKLIPVLGTVGGTKEESEQTARNIENWLAGRSKTKPQRKVRHV